MRTFLATTQNNVPVTGVPGGTVAIYNSGVDGTDNSAAVDPHANLSKVGFHSAFDYVGVASEHFHAISIPATSAGNALVAGDVVLFAHGQGAPPLLMAQYSTDNANWFSAHGTTYTTIGAAFTHRGFHVQADGANVYVRWSSIGNRAALTVYFRVQILARSFDAPRPDTGVVIDATPSRIRLADGRFDTNNKYIQEPASGQAFTALHTSGQTLQMFDGDEPSEINFGVGTSGLLGNFGHRPVGVSADGQSLTYLPPAAPLIGRTQVPLVFEGPSGATPGFELSATRMRVATPGGVELLDTSRRMLAITDEFRGNISVLQHGATAHEAEYPRTNILASKSITPGASLIFGWLQINAVTGGSYIAPARPMEFSGTVVLWVDDVAFSGVLWTRQAVFVSPRIVGNTLQVVEQYYNHDLFGHTATLTPAVNARFHLFAAALVGGF